MKLTEKQIDYYKKLDNADLGHTVQEFNYDLQQAQNYLSDALDNIEVVLAHMDVVASILKERATVVDAPSNP